MAHDGCLYLLCTNMEQPPLSSHNNRDIMEYQHGPLGDGCLYLLGTNRPLSVNPLSSHNNRDIVDDQHGPTMDAFIC